MWKFVRNGIAGKSLTEKNRVSGLLTNRKKVGISNSTNGKEIVFQISLTEIKSAFKYHNGRKNYTQIS